MSNRKLVSVQEITGIDPIEGADRVEVARVLGWRVVVGELDRMRTLLELDVDRRTGRSRPDPAKDAREASKRGPDAAASAWVKARMGKTPPNPPDRH